MIIMLSSALDENKSHDLAAVIGVPSIVIELKRGDSASDLDDLAADAMRQIRDREYHHGLSGRVLLYGMAFHGKDARIVSEEFDDRAGPVA